MDRKRMKPYSRSGMFLLTLCLCLSMIAIMTACQGGGGATDDVQVPETTSTTSSTESTESVEVPIMSDLPEPSDGVKKIEVPTQTSDSVPTDDANGRWKAFSHGGITVEPGDDMKSVLQGLGDPISTYESPSCIFDGNDLVYTYDGFEVNAAMIDGLETCVALFVTDDSIQTPEGISIGSSLADVLGAFGEPDEEETGQYTWFEDDRELVIVVIDDRVTSISYLMLVNTDTR